MVSEMYGVSMGWGVFVWWGVSIGWGVCVVGCVMLVWDGVYCFLLQWDVWWGI